MQMGGVGQRSMQTWQDNSINNQNIMGGLNQSSGLQNGQINGSFENTNQIGIYNQRGYVSNFGGLN